MAVKIEFTSPMVFIEKLSNFCKKLIPIFLLFLLIMVNIVFWVKYTSPTISYLLKWGVCFFNGHTLRNAGTNINFTV